MKHGGNLRAACSIYGNHQFLDFSANINPLGIPEPIRMVWLQNIDAVVHYPDPDCELLGEAIAELEQIPVTSVLCGNGSSELLFLALEVKKPKRVLLLSPCFVEYKEAALAAGAEIVWHNLEQEKNFQWQLEDLSLDDINMVIIGNPNNPTAQCVSVEIMKGLVQRCQTRGIDLLIDEAFIDLTLDKPTLIHTAVLNEHLLVLRAFTKSLAVPGVRIGYAVAGASWLKAMKDKQVPWSVNIFAQQIASALPNLSEYKSETQRWLAQELSYVYQSMKGLASIEAIEPKTNFMLWHVQKDAVELREYLVEKHHILIRDCSNYYGLSQGWFRTAIRLRQENDQLFRAIGEFLETSNLE